MLFRSEKLEQWEKEYQRAVEMCAAEKSVRQIEKLRDLVKNGSVEEYYNKVHSYIADWKNEYRKQISV